MPYYDPLAAKFANRSLDPWQKSSKNFDFDSGFVGWIQKYLETRKLPHDVVSAKAWINKSKFDGERYELCELQWEAYQESITVKPQPVLLNVGSNHGLSVGSGDSAGEFGVDGAVDEVDDHHPNLPDHLRQRDGETKAEQNARIREYVRQKLPSLEQTMSFGSKK